MASFLASSLRAGALPSARMFVSPAAKQFTTQPAVLRMIRPNMAARVAAFHTSKKMQILPAGPQVIEGDVNDPVTIPKANPSHGVYHWTFERLVCLSCIPLTIAPFAAGSLNPVMDALVVSGLILHSHMSFASVITDYFPKYKIPTISAILTWLLRIATAGVTYGFYQLQTNDVGLTETVKRVWTA